MKYKKIAFQVDIARQIEKPETLKRIIDFGGSVGYNELFLYGEGAFEYKKHPECSRKWALKQDDFINLQDYASEKYKMFLIPVIPALGHANYALDSKKFEHLREVKGHVKPVIKTSMRQFCTSNPESYSVIEELLAEWMEITRAPYIHIGGDESWNFATCPECRRKAEKIGRGRSLAEHFNSVNGIVKKHGKQTIIWHDMLFYYQDCLSLLDKDIIICDWHYEENIEHNPGISIYNWSKTDFLKAYENEKLSAYICPMSKFNFPKESSNIKTFIENSQDKKTIGFLNTVWEMKKIPYASCFPSLAYGAACCQAENLPEPRVFLRQFGKKHFMGEIDLFPYLVDLFSEIAEENIFPGLDNWITYQNPDHLLRQASKMDEGIKVLEKLEPKTESGKAYLESLELIFKRMAISKRLQGRINEIAREYLRKSSRINKKMISEKLLDIDILLQKIPGQIKLECETWNKSRYQEEADKIIFEWSNAVQQVGEFIESVNKILSGEMNAQTFFPNILELTIVNNDCAWQELTIFSAENRGEYEKVGTYPQCGPFGKYVKTFKIPNKGDFIKLQIGGLGQLNLHYLRIISPGQELIPVEIIKTKGSVITPENILTDDCKPALIGDVETKRYYSIATEQPKSFIEIKNEVIC